jgi:CheY-like chemotaxis protein
LAITRRLVEMQGGSIAVESVEGRGSTFRVRLPMRAIEEPARMAGGAQSDADKLCAVPLGRCSTVLVVEDNPVNHKVVAAMLRKHGYRVTTAAHGGEVIPALERDPAAVVLMDIQMPEVDGIEATQRLRSHPRWRDIPVIAMTAHAMSGDRERCIEAGMNAYVSKPINRAQLIATIEKLLSDDAGDWRSRLAAASPDLGRPAEKEPQRRTWEADREAGATFAGLAR